jgi:AraC-like DNA-binding protein
LNIEQFAKNIGISARDVSYTINKVFGKNFFEFINFYRIEAAKRLLENADQTQMTVLEVLMTSGFNSKSSFQRFFKRFTGMSPTEYRERHLKGLTSQNAPNPVNDTHQQQY